MMPNATVNTTVVHYDTIAEYACDIGFKFSDNDTVKTRRCTELPQWEPVDEEWDSCESE